MELHRQTLRGRDSATPTGGEPARCSDRRGPPVRRNGGQEENLVLAFPLEALGAGLWPAHHEIRLVRQVGGESRKQAGLVYVPVVDSGRNQLGPFFQREFELQRLARMEYGWWLVAARERGTPGGCGMPSSPAFLHNPLRCVPDESLPSELEKVVAAKTAPARLQKPLECRLHGIPDAYPSEIDGSAMWTACREQPHDGADHDSVSAFGVLDGAE